MPSTYQIKLINGDQLTYEADNVETSATSCTGINNGVVQWVVPLSQIVSIAKQ